MKGLIDGLHFLQFKLLPGIDIFLHADLLCMFKLGVFNLQTLCCEGRMRCIRVGFLCLMQAQQQRCPHGLELVFLLT